LQAHLTTNATENTRTKPVLAAAALQVMTSSTHIVPVFVGDPERYKQASDLLLADRGAHTHALVENQVRGFIAHPAAGYR
jgi:7-keto-8-aminopelargonate synthetase-like enzyme